MNLSSHRQKIAFLLKMRGRLEQGMLGTRLPLVAASWVLYQNVCGKKACGCKAGRTHGPYAYLSFKVKGKTRLKMVPKDQWERLGAGVKRYQQFQRDLKQVRRLNREVEGLYKQLRSRLVVKGL